MQGALLRQLETLSPFERWLHVQPLRRAVRRRPPQAQEICVSLGRRADRGVGVCLEHTWSLVVCGGGHQGHTLFPLGNTCVSFLKRQAAPECFVGHALVAEVAARAPGVPATSSGSLASGHAPFT